MKLISESSDRVNLLVEDTETGSKNYFIEGIFIEAETKNKNNRIYPLKVIREEVSRYNENYVRQNRAVGELDHPDGPDINSDRVSHIITSLREDGNTIIGKAKVLDTPCGKIMKEFIKEGIKYGVSTRALGSILNSGGVDVVQEDFHLCAVDAVHDPSAPKAFVNGLYEKKEWIWNNGILVEKVLEEIKRDIDKAPTRKIEQVSIAAFQKFLKSIK